MSNVLKKMKQTLMPVLGILTFIVLFIVGIVLFSYVLILAAIAGFVLFVIAYIRAKILERRFKQQRQTQPKSSGRVIDHDD